MQRDPRDPRMITNGEPARTNGNPRGDPRDRRDDRSRDRDGRIVTDGSGSRRERNLNAELDLPPNVITNIKQLSESELRPSIFGGIPDDMLIKYRAVEKLAMVSFCFSSTGRWRSWLW